MSDRFPPDDFDGYDYGDEFSKGEFNPDDFWMMSEEEFLKRQLEPPPIQDMPFNDIPFPEAWEDYALVFTEDDDIQLDSFDHETVAVLNLKDVDPREMRRHVFADRQDAVDWLIKTGLLLIGSLVDLGGGFYGIAVHNTGKSSVAS